MARKYKSKLQLYRSAEFKMELESDISDALRQLQGEALVKVLRSAAYAGAVVIYDEMRARVPVKTGELKNSIYHWFDTKSSTPTSQGYLIGPNKTKASHWYNVEFGHWRYNRSANGRWLRSKSNPNKRGPAAHDLEGAQRPPVWTPPHSYIRAAWEARKQRALDRMRVRAKERLAEVIAGKE